LQADKRKACGVGFGLTLLASAFNAGLKLTAPAAIGERFGIAVPLANAGRALDATAKKVVIGCRASVSNRRPGRKTALS
jgi:hypothetical protein